MYHGGDRPAPPGPPGPRPYRRRLLRHPSACGAAVAGVTARGLEPALFELIDRHYLAAVNEWKHTGLREDAAVLAARPDRHPRARRAGSGRGDPRGVRRGRRHRGDHVHRRRRGRSALRRPAAGVFGAAAARRRDPGRGRLPAPRATGRDADAGREIAARHDTSSRMRPTPGTATCTRCSSHRAATRRRGSVAGRVRRHHRGRARHGRHRHRRARRWDPQTRRHAAGAGAGRGGHAT